MTVSTPLRLLVLDTGLGACTAAVTDVAGAEVSTVHEERLAMTRGHAEALMPMIAACLGPAPARTIDRIAVTRGPGSFTGLRVALAAARGLSAAWSLPAFGVDTLRALAAHRRGAGGPVAAVVDARRDEAYMQPFTSTGAPFGPAVIASYDEIRKRLNALAAASEAWSFVGSGAERLHGMMPRSAAFALQAPHAVDLARLGAAAPDDASPPRPLYIRGADARVSSRSSLRQGVPTS